MTSHDETTTEATPVELLASFQAEFKGEGRKVYDSSEDHDDEEGTDNGS